jgi:hypothetical protein
MDKPETIAPLGLGALAADITVVFGEAGLARGDTIQAVFVARSHCTHGCETAYSYDKGDAVFSTSGFSVRTYGTRAKTDVS